MINKFFRSKYLLISGIVILYLSVFAPYILYNGFIVDDWGILYAGSKHASYFYIFGTYFPFMTFRPLQPLFFSLVVFFKDHAIIYNLINLVFYLGGFFLLAHLMRCVLGRLYFYIMLMILPFSVISNTWLFSALSLMGSNFSLLLWSLSLLFLYRHALTNRAIHYIFSYLFILIGWLIYDQIIFLTLCNVFFPIYVYFSNHEYRFKTLVIKIMQYSFPLVIVAAMILSYQRIVVPELGGQNLSRFAFTEHMFYNIPGNLAIYLGKISLQLPVLLMTSFRYMSIESLWNYVIPVIVMFTCFIGLVISRRKDSAAGIRFPGLVTGFFILFVFFNFLLFILSGYPFEFGRYLNRAMHGVWISLAMLMAYLTTRVFHSYVRYLSLLIMVMILLAFITQRDIYNRSYQLQRRIMNDCITMVNKDKEFKSGGIILANVPAYFTRNYNNEIIFSQPWDFGAALALYSKDHIKEAIPFTVQSIREGQVKVINDSVLVNGWWKKRIEGLWYYEYNIRNQRSELRRINNTDEMKKLLFEELFLENLNAYNQPDYERVRVDPPSWIWNLLR